MAEKISLKAGIETLKGVGVKRAQLFQKLGVDSIYSLLRYYPRNYLNFTEYTSISDVQIGEVCTIRAKVFHKLPEAKIRKGLSVYKIMVTDGENDLTVTIFNSKYMAQALEIDREYVFHGKMSGNFLRKEMTAPIFVPYREKMEMQPIYPLTEGLTNKMVQNTMESALQLMAESDYDPLPADLIEACDLCSFSYAIQQIHFPKSVTALEAARKRLIFEELLTLQLGMLLLRSRNRNSTAIKLHQTDWSSFELLLPFSLTNAQKRAIEESIRDMGADTPMNRLIQGDVGSGKTMVAAALSFLLAQNGYQTAIMVPTEILAQQHYETFRKLFVDTDLRVCLLTGSMAKGAKQAQSQKIANGEYDIIIGTHALIQDSVQFHALGLVVTDEQHRFGVVQRNRLAKKGDNPHLLVMSATPIPRTLGLIIYGDLDISVIDELPAGRQQIDTLLIDQKKRARALGFIREKLEAGLQAYIVCPLIEEGENELQSVTRYAEILSHGPFQGCRLEVLHGRLKAKEKEQIMTRFKNGETQLLVSTTVIEVGVDVPNAVIMMVENAERYGLSQLHQLRGRVGRGAEKSYCILVSNYRGDETAHRLKVMCQTADGFKIAEEDLKLRGPGDFFGQRQHGLPDLKIADMSSNMEIMRQTQVVARELIADDPNLDSPDHKGLRRLVSLLFEKNAGQLFN